MRLRTDGQAEKPLRRLSTQENGPSARSRMCRWRSLWRRCLIQCAEGAASIAPHWSVTSETEIAYHNGDEATAMPNERFIEQPTYVGRSHDFHDTLEAAATATGVCYVLSRSYNGVMR